MAPKPSGWQIFFEIRKFSPVGRPTGRFPRFRGAQRAGRGAGHPAQRAVSGASGASGAGGREEISGFGPRGGCTGFARSRLRPDPAKAAPSSNISSKGSNGRGGSNGGSNGTPKKSDPAHLAASRVSLGRGYLDALGKWPRAAEGVRFFHVVQKIWLDAPRAPAGRTRGSEPAAGLRETRDCGPRTKAPRPAKGESGLPGKGIFALCAV